MYEPYLTREQLAEHIRKSPFSVDRLRRKRVIPAIKIGGEWRFRLSDVERALARYTVKEVC